MDIKKLTILKTVIQRVPEEWEKLQAFMGKFGLPYKGQSLPACTQEALLSLCVQKRIHFPAEVKDCLLYTSDAADE